jgi:hypothetical protein
MKWLLPLLLTGLLSAAPGPQLFYSRAFPGSVPAYFQVTLEQDGNAEYAESANDDLPVKFRLPESHASQIFALAEKLDNFQRPIESPAKVAFTGAKIFRYANGSEKHEVKFNHSEDAVARELVGWFERMAESAQRRIDLERAAKYDKLGVPRALMLLQAAMNQKRLVGLDQFLPMLDRIAKNETYMHTARARASEIAEAIRNYQP